MERDREGMWLEAPARPSTRNMFRDERATEAVFTFLRETRVGCMQISEGEDKSDEEEGPGRHRTRREGREGRARHFSVVFCPCSLGAFFFFGGSGEEELYYDGNSV